MAVWDEQEERIEMRLRATRPMVAHLPGADLEVCFAEGEELRTEISANFRPSGIAGEPAAADLSVAGQWTDPQACFALTLAEPSWDGRRLG